MANKLLSWAGKQITKSLAYGDYIDVVAPSIYRGGLFNGSFFFGGNGLDYRFAYSNYYSGIAAYHSCPPLAAVVNRKAQCYINGETKVENTQGKEAQGNDAKRLRLLLNRPNALQTWRQFEAQQYIYVQIFGWCLTLPIMVAGFEKADPTNASSLWNIPPYMLEIKEKDKLFYQTDLKGMVESIKINYKGITTELPLDNLFIFKDFTPGVWSMLFPESRIKALAMPINNIIGAYISRNELINYAGAQGIFSPEGKDVAGTIPLKPEEKTQLQDDFKRQYGIQRGQFRYIIAPTAMNWVGIGKPTKDLMLFEEIVDDVMRICDGYNYPSPLLNSEKGPSVSNTSVYQAQVYSDGIIPESLDLYEQWNAYLGTANYNLKLCKDYSEIPALQDNRVESGRALYYLNQSNMLLWQQNLITANQVLEANEMDPVPGWDIYYSDFVAQGKIFPTTTNQSNSNSNNNEITQQNANQ